MIDAAAFQATFVKTVPVGGRKVVQFVFEVPVEKATAALNMLGGFPNAADNIWCGIVRLTQEAAQEPAPVSPVARVASRLTTQAAILCGDPMFHHFLNEEYKSSLPNGCAVTTEEGAADMVRYICNVKSRRDIIIGTPAGDAWDGLHRRFVCWEQSIDPQ